MPLDLPFPFTLPRLFRSPAISNFFSFPLGLGNSGVRLYHSFKVSDLILDFFAEEKSAAVEFQGNPAYFGKRTKDGLFTSYKAKSVKKKVLK